MIVATCCMSWTKKKTGRRFSRKVEVEGKGVIGLVLEDEKQFRVPVAPDVERHAKMLVLGRDHLANEPEGNPGEAIACLRGDKPNAAAQKLRKFQQGAQGAMHGLTKARGTLVAPPWREPIFRLSAS